jgi:two-component system phosphate regulon sensor histidine kinase PhoR
MKNGLIRRLVILGVICIAGIIGIQGWWLSRTWDLKSQEFDQRVHIALLQVASDLEAFSSSTLPNEDLVTQLESNYYVVNINGNINPSNLEFFLKKRLNEVAVSDDFEYGIFDCHSKKMIYGQSIKNKPGSEPGELSAPLPIYEQLTYYFGVRFPNRTGYLLSSIKVTLLLSLVLLFIAIFYAYAILIILRQKRLSELQKDFINNMTHEFKTPISTIKISADVLLSNDKIKDDSRLVRYSTIIKEQNEHLNNQVEKILQLAKFEEDSVALKLEKVELNQWIKNMLPSIELKVHGRNGHFELDLDKDPLYIKADLLHLTNIVHNLVDNAIKYCKDNPKVTIKTYHKGAMVYFKIQDEGIGIAKEHQKKVFSKFYRAPTGNVHNVKGFGLGLFYIKNICNELGWKVSLESVVGKGTDLQIAIPSYVAS